MKIRVVSSREEIFTLNPNDRIAHLAFRPSTKISLDWLKPAQRLR